METQKIRIAALNGVGIYHGKRKTVRIFLDGVGHTDEEALAMLNVNIDKELINLRHYEFKKPIHIHDAERVIDGDWSSIIRPVFFSILTDKYNPVFVPFEERTQLTAV